MYGPHEQLFFPQHTICIDIWEYHVTHPEHAHFHPPRSTAYPCDLFPERKERKRENTERQSPFCAGHALPGTWSARQGQPMEQFSDRAQEGHGEVAWSRLFMLIAGSRQRSAPVPTPAPFKGGSIAAGRAVPQQL